MIDIASLKELIKDNVDKIWHRDIDELCFFAAKGQRAWELEWQVNPDRSGGQFTDEEIERSRRGGEGW